MVNVAIFCMDNAIQEKIKEKVERLEPAWKVYLYTDEKEIEKDMFKKHFSIFFMELEEENQSGYYLSKEIRKYSANAVIIFIAGKETNACQAFEVGALRFLKKPFDNEKLEEAINRAEHVVSEESIYFPYKKRGYVYQIRLSDVYMFERKERISEIHTVCGKVEKIYVSLNRLENWLDPRCFVRTHAKYIVNVSYIDCIKESIVVLNNEKSIPLARTRKKKVEDVYKQYTYKTNKSAVVQAIE